MQMDDEDQLGKGGQAVDGTRRDQQAASSWTSGSVFEGLGRGWTRAWVGG